MRLLEDDGHGNLGLVEKHNNDIPRYAILSHTWGPDKDEINYKDITEGTGRNKIGYKKIEFCRAQATSDGLRYFWVDTCCIDKSSSAELSEAINSMFRWYQNADKCYVYLSDVSTSKLGTDIQSLSTLETAFRGSRWFTRGWTLQELIAPASVEFFSQEAQRLGSKKSLEEEIHEITGIGIEALRGAPLAQFTIEQRLAWAKHRETKRPEDKAYSLLGICNIDMSLRYGEGGDKAYERLRRKIGKSLICTSSAGLPKAPPSPSSTVPFRRDVDAVDLRTLHNHGILLDQSQQPSCSANLDRTPEFTINDIMHSLAKLSDKIEDDQRLRFPPRPWHEKPGMSTHVSSTQVEGADSARTRNRFLLADVILVLKPVMLITVGMLCTRPERKPFLEMLITKHGLNPVLPALLVLFALHVAGLAESIPRQFLLSGSNNMSFEDALGESIKLPYSTYRHIKIFQAFLEVHFEGKQGSYKVNKGEYQISVRNRTQSGIVSQKEWALLLTAKSKMIMKMLFAAQEAICVDCLGPLEKKFTPSQYHCLFCDHLYSEAFVNKARLPRDIVRARSKLPQLQSIMVHDLRHLTGGGKHEAAVGEFDDPEIPEERHTMPVQDEPPQLGAVGEQKSRLPFKNMSLVTTTAVSKILAVTCGARWSRDWRLVTFAFQTRLVLEDAALQDDKFFVRSPLKQLRPRAGTIIDGTAGDKEELDVSYRKRDHARRFFIPGRVFAVLWHEPAGGVDDKYNLGSKFGLSIVSHVRRMVVVKELHGYCWAVPIHTYGGHGIAKPGFNKHDIDAHAIIHDKHLRAHADLNEPTMSKLPISVAMNPGESLHPMSRINFSRVHTVEHEVKAKDVGRISPESMSDFLEHWSAQMKGQLSRSAKEGIAVTHATSEAP